MINLSDCFEKIFIISLDQHEDRRTRLLRQLNEQGVYSPKVEVIRAIHGDSVGVPAWWKNGGGAWGCLLSHYAVIQKAAMDGLENFLVLEDDTILGPRFAEQLDACWPSVPQNWDQLYLGGQHLLEPVTISEHWVKAMDINRTHAYALNKRVYKEVGAHIMYAPDYINAANKNHNRHVDHQLGQAHRRGDWNCVAMKTWLFGQGENRSWINGRWHPDKWWDYPQDDCFRYLPYVIVENDGLFKEIRGKNWRGKNRHGETAKNLHFGWKLGPDHLSTKEGWAMRERPAMLHAALGTVAQEAFDCRRIPGFYGNQKQVDFLRAGWPGGNITLRELKDSGGIASTIESMADYPWNGILNPK